MTKSEVTAKIKAILSKDPILVHADIRVIFSDKKVKNETENKT